MLFSLINTDKYRSNDIDQRNLLSHFIICDTNFSDIRANSDLRAPSGRHCPDEIALSVLVLNNLVILASLKNNFSFSFRTF